MRDAVIDRQFQHLRVDHDEFAAVGRHPVQDRQDHRVDADRLAGAGGAGDQQMRHLGEVGQYRLARDVLAEDQRQPPRMLFVDRRIEQFAQVDGLGSAVRQFDADHAAPRHDRDAHRNGAHRAGDVVSEPDDARGLDAGRRLELVQGHDRTRADLHDLAAYPVIFEHGFEHARVFFERLLVDRGGLGGRRPLQDVERRQYRLLVGDEVEPRLALLLPAGRVWRSARAALSADEPGPPAFRHRRWRRRRPGAVEPGLAPAGQRRHDAAPLRVARVRGEGVGMLGTRLPAHLPPPAQQPPAEPGRDHRPAPRDRRRPPGAAAGAVAERAPVAPRQPEDQQQQQAERRGRNHRHRQRQRPEPGRDQSRCISQPRAPP